MTTQPWVSDNTDTISADQAKKFLEWMPTATKEEIEIIAVNYKARDRMVYASAYTKTRDRIGYATASAYAYAYASASAYAFAAIAVRNQISVEDFEILIQPVRFILERLEIVEPISEVKE